MDKVKFLGQEKTILQTAEDTAKVLERIHKDGYLGVKKTLKLFRRRFEGVREEALSSNCLVLRGLPARFRLQTLSPTPRNDGVSIPLGCNKH